MPRPPTAGGGPIPRWLVAAGSAAIIIHLAAIIIPILDAPSGPWPSPMGPEFGDVPHFAHEAAGLAAVHADGLRLAHSVHYDFLTSRPAQIPGVAFDVRLRNQAGEVIGEFHFPDPEANPWVRSRQEMLARNLAFDQQIAPQGGEVIPAPGAKAPTVAIWALPGEDFTGTRPPAPPPEGNVAVHLQTVPQHRVPRPPQGRPVWRPNDLSLVLVRSYARYLCRTHGAASAEIVRHMRQPIPPAVLFGEPTPPGAFEDLVANYGEMTE